MTLLEKIKKLKWFDSISKLRDILEELYNSSSGGSGGNQDLQSVLNNGNTTTTGITLTNNSNSISTILPYAIIYSGYSGEELDNKIQIEKERVYFSRTSVGGVDSGGNVSLQKDNLLDGQSYILQLPSKTSGTYTIATLDDIKKIDLSDRIYTNNAAAITGGLTVNDLYRTSTGELRIVV